MDSNVHMVSQTIKYSDGTETVINYKGVIVDGILTEDKPEVASETASEVVEATPEVVESVESPVIEETPEIVEEVVG